MKVCQEGLYVVLIYKGKRIEMPWRAANRLSIALKVQANKCAQQEKHAEIAYDQAILLRRGIRLGLSNNPDIKREAMKEAAYNSDLRRYIPHVPEGIRSQEVVGTPTLIKHRPKRRNNGR